MKALRRIGAFRIVFICSMLIVLVSGCSESPSEPEPKAAIIGLQFEKTWDPPITPEPGWEMIDVDLNRGCGESFIYLCYKNGLDDQESISDITFIVNNQEVPPGYTKIAQDLNADVGGSFIYLCYKKEMTGKPIRRLNVLVGENATPDAGFYFAKNYYSGAKQDLNQGAGGNFIWLVYSYSLH